MAQPFDNNRGVEITDGDAAEIAQLYDPGDLAPYWDSPYSPADLNEAEIAALKSLCDLVGAKDVAARRWEVEQSWEARLFDRGYQYLLPRRGGGWILPPFAGDYQRKASGRGNKFYGYETNIYTTYGEIITAALTRDIPSVRFFPVNPFSDRDITAADAATRYAAVFRRDNDLLELQHQLVYYLRNDGRAVTVVNHLLDAQRFGRCDKEPDVMPENETSLDEAKIYILRHAETDMNDAGLARGRSPAPINERGQRHIEQAAEWLKGKPLRQIVSSPVERARQSAEILARTLDLPIETDDRLASLNIGELAGKSAEDIRPIIEEMKEQPDTPFPGGESLDQFHARVAAALSDYNRQPGTLVVTHDSVIGAIFQLLGGPENQGGDIEPASVIGIFPNQDGTLRANVVWPAIRQAIISQKNRSRARGKEIVEVYGKLEAKVPINANLLSDCPFVQISKEYDYAYVRGMFPDKARKIHPGGAGAGENELDRIARINSYLALEASYVTGDSMVRDCTVQRSWFRPAFFMEVSNPEVRKSLLEKFPDGCLVIYAGEAFILARNENMDDHLSIIHAFPGSGMNRISLCAKLLSLQKRLNNWIDLINDFFIRTIPARHINSRVYDLEAIEDQPQQPGAFIPFDGAIAAEYSAQGVANIWVEPMPQPQPTLPDFIQQFITNLPQLLSGALPSLFGSAANTDTVGGIAIQRDQALGRLGTPWHSIQMATCRYFSQAVRLAAACRLEPIFGTLANGEALRIELAELKGGTQAYPEEDSNFPESWVQRQSRYQQLLIESRQNPALGALLELPANMKTARDLAGFGDLIVPAAEAYEKQLGELSLLLHGQPQPNPQWAQLEQQIVMMQQMGIQPPPELMQQMQAIPQEISSVPIDEATDEHAIEASACKDWINSPPGRKMRNGNAQDRAGFQNVRLHFLEHQAAAAKGQKPQLPKPPSLAINFKDLPPEAAAEVLQAEGIGGDAQDVLQSREAQALIKKSSKVGAHLPQGA